MWPKEMDLHVYGRTSKIGYAARERTVRYLQNNGSPKTPSRKGTQCSTLEIGSSMPDTERAAFLDKVGRPALGHEHPMSGIGRLAAQDSNSHDR